VSHGRFLLETSSNSLVRYLSTLEEIISESDVALVEIRHHQEKVNGRRHWTSMGPSSDIAYCPALTIS
jgi:hypothetical protein